MDYSVIPACPFCGERKLKFHHDKNLLCCLHSDCAINGVWIDEEKWKQRRRKEDNHNEMFKKLHELSTKINETLADSNINDFHFAFMDCNKRLKDILLKYDDFLPVPEELMTEHDKEKIKKNFEKYSRALSKCNCGKNAIHNFCEACMVVHNQKGPY